MINKKITCSRVVDIILENKGDKNIEFDYQRLAPKNYLLLMLYAIDKNHPLFNIGPEEIFIQSNI